MLRVHTKDGLTHRVDLRDAREAEQWLRELKNPSYQTEITGFTVAHRGVLYSLPRPQGFDRISFVVERIEPNPERKLKGGERVTCFAGDVRISLMVHEAQKAVRVTLARLGKQRFNPFLR